MPAQVCSAPADTEYVLQLCQLPNRCTPTPAPPTRSRPPSSAVCFPATGGARAWKMLSCTGRVRARNGQTRRA